MQLNFERKFKRHHFVASGKFPSASKESVTSFTHIGFIPIHYKEVEVLFWSMHEIDGTFIT